MSKQIETPKFVYLLNAMENASVQANPSNHGYAGHRAKVLNYVARLERELSEVTRERDGLKLDGQHGEAVLDSYAQENQRLFDRAIGGERERDEAKTQSGNLMAVVEDLHKALGVRFGDDPYVVIEKLKNDQRELEHLEKLMRSER